MSPVTLVGQVTYNTLGALAQMRKTIPNETETRSYDAFQRVTSMTMFDQTVIAYNYASTANDGKIISQTTTPSGGSAETVNYTYDSLGRLTQAATADAGGWGDVLDVSMILCFRHSRIRILCARSHKFSARTGGERNGDCYGIRCCGHWQWCYTATTEFRDYKNQPKRRFFPNW